MSSDSLPIPDDLVQPVPISSTTFFLTAALIWSTLFYTKNPLQYYLKYVTYALIVIVVATFTIFLCLLRPCDARNVAVVAKVLSFFFQIFQIDIQLENSKYFQSKEPFILVCNHQSSLDFLTMMKVWPGGNCTPLAKKELFYSGPFGLAIWLCGITFIDRLNPQKARGTIDKLAKKINDENLRVWIYPEGTRSPSTNLLPFKKGAFHLAIQAQIPIICVVTSSYSNFYHKREKKFDFGGKVKVRVLPPFNTTGMTLDSVAQLTKHLQDLMQREFDLLNKEIGLDQKYYIKAKSNEETNEKTHDVTRTFVQDLDYTQISDVTQMNSLISQTDLTSQLQNDSNNNSVTEDDTGKKVN
ncbi:1-acyl-sn-glycerol-3-phosphate acyltransferase alpha [Brachionus plicatilis]|uniref:1-acyl-sn-glycerol-3-phosphate acyltransferase n=1 Tax=Brachionus plicatilis TaxID=10195 RepID=A0A3M7QN87_BRAPC|nr:1-acyl-sn-glycerol-3-phosphate acyltransferase alpha [Brachionus plicatilis]